MPIISQLKIEQTGALFLAVEWDLQAGAWVAKAAPHGRIIFIEIDHEGSYHVVCRKECRDADRHFGNLLAPLRRNEPYCP
jgi:hypothetical protein